LEGQAGFGHVGAGRVTASLGLRWGVLVSYWENGKHWENESNTVKDLEEEIYGVQRIHPGPKVRTGHTGNVNYK